MLEGRIRTLAARQAADLGRDNGAGSWSYKLPLQRLPDRTPRTAGAATLRATLCDLLRLKDWSKNHTHGMQRTV